MSQSIATAAGPVAKDCDSADELANLTSASDSDLDLSSVSDTGDLASSDFLLTDLRTRDLSGEFSSVYTEHVPFSQT